MVYVIFLCFLFLEETMSVLSNVVSVDENQQMAYYRHKNLNYCICLPPFNNISRSLWKLRKTIAVNPQAVSRMQLFITLTIDEEHYKGPDIVLTKYIRSFLNRVNTMFRMRAQRNGYQWIRPLWLWRVEFGAEGGRIHVHLMTNLRHINYIKEKKLSDYVEKVWGLGKINKFKRFGQNEHRKIANYVSKYISKEQEQHQVKMNVSVKTAKMWGVSRGFAYRYVTIFKKTDENDFLEWQASEQASLAKYIQREIDYNPLHHRKLVAKQYNKKTDFISKIILQIETDPSLSSNAKLWIDINVHKRYKLIDSFESS